MGGAARSCRSPTVTPGTCEPPEATTADSAVSVGAAGHRPVGPVAHRSSGGGRLPSRDRVTGRTDTAHTLALPDAGIAVHARPVWTQGAGPDGPWLCGLEVQEPDPLVNRAWRAFVDAVGV